MNRSSVFIFVCVTVVVIIIVAFKYTTIFEMFGVSNGKATIKGCSDFGDEIILPRPSWPGAECMRQHAPGIYRLNRFLSPNECKHIIDQAQSGFQRSQVVNDNDGTDTQSVDRTSSSSYLDRAQTTMIADIERRAASVFGCPVYCVEPLQVVRYEPGQKFNAHYDFFHHVSGMSGQRYATILVYLNDDFGGGTTSFPKCNIEAKPLTGDAVSWYNCFPNEAGKCICFDDALHQGNPPTTGVKYALNIWIRF